MYDSSAIDVITATLLYQVFWKQGRSYDKMIRRELTVMDEEIEELCRQMKEVAVVNAKSESQKEAVKDVTKNILPSWGLLAEAEDSSIHPTNGYAFCNIADVLADTTQGAERTT